MNTWALQDAKAKFSEMVENAHRQGPQLVTRRGRAAVVVMAISQFQQMTRGRNSRDLVRFFRNSPLAELPPRWLRRDTDLGREVAF